MTWILGSGIPFGYGALISDVRASWPDGRVLDRLQKIHSVGPGLVAGFAGSVKVGFRMIEIMRYRWSMPGVMFHVMEEAWHWHRFARWLYQEKLPDEFKPLGCELFIAGVSPERHPLGNFSYAVAMRAPDFEPKRAKDWTWESIGTGAKHAAAAQFKDVQTNMDVFAQGEVNNPGGCAFMAAHSVADDLESSPMASVSPLLQVAIVRARDCVIRNLKREHRGAWTIASEEDPASDQLLTTWADFDAASAQAGLDASAAVT